MTQLTDLFKGLMFLDGHFTHPEDLAGTAPVQAAPAPAPATADPEPRLGLLQSLLLLGGRPMHAGHNLDLEEPFEVVPAANDAAHAPVCAACG